MAPPPRLYQPERRAASYFTGPPEPPPENRSPFRQTLEPSCELSYANPTSQASPVYPSSYNPIPNLTAEAYRSLEFSNVVRPNDPVTFAPAAPFPEKLINWTHEIHRFDYAHRRVIVTQEDNRHRAGLLTVKTEYMDLLDYNTSGRSLKDHTKVIISQPPPNYSLDRY